MAFYANLDLPVGQRLDKLDRRKLTALIHVENFERNIPGQRLLDGRNAGVALQRARHPPGEHPASEPVHAGREIYGAARHGEVINVHPPDLIGSIDGKVEHKVPIDFVPMGWFEVFGLRYGVVILIRFSSVATGGRPTLTPSFTAAPAPAGFLQRAGPWL
jgi:hypothetical protein